MPTPIKVLVRLPEDGGGGGGGPSAPIGQGRQFSLLAAQRCMRVEDAVTGRRKVKANARCKLLPVAPRKPMPKCGPCMASPITGSEEPGQC